MPYTRKQIKRINNVKGEPFLAGEHSLALRTSESYIRRRLFALEDATINTLYRKWKAAFGDIKAHALDAGNRLNVGTLGITPEALNWKRDVMEYAGLRYRRLMLDIADTVLERATLAYALGYYGRAYVLDMATAPDAQVKVPRLENRGVTRRVIQPRLKEAITPDQFVIDLLGDNWQDTYTDIGDELLIKTRRAIDAGTANGDSLNTLLNGLASVMGVDKAQKGAFAQTNGVTRDYMLGAGSNGGNDLYKINEVWVLGLMWVATASDNRTCPTCRSLHGTVWSLGDKNMLVAPFDSHPRCILPGNEVQLPGALVGTAKSFYHGRCVEFTFLNGRKLSVTPNHPILTPHGWVKAQFLREGSDVVHAVDAEWIISTINPNNDNRPTLIEDVVSAFEKNGEMLTRRMKLAPEDFYGDAEFIKGDVDIVISNSLLLSNSKADVAQPLSHLEFNWGSVQHLAFPAFSPSDALGNGDSAFFSCPVCGGKHSFSLFGGGSIPSNKHAIGNIARGDTGLNNSPSQHGSVNTNFVRKGLLTFTGDIAPQDVIEVGNMDTSPASSNASSFQNSVEMSGTDPQLAHDFTSRFANSVAIDKIVNVRWFEYSGHVYDLQVEPYELYICNGVIVKNCRCGMLPVILPGSGTPDDEPPRDTWDEWLDEMNELWWLRDELGRAELDSSLIGA